MIKNLKIFSKTFRFRSGTFGNLFQRKPRQQRRKADVIEKEKKPLQIVNKRNKNKETTPEEIERVNTIIRNHFEQQDR